MRKSLEERFEEMHEKIPEIGCWIWTASTDKHGYGYIKVNGKTTKAPRASWLIHTGESPGERWVLHTCDNPSCVNPHHLFLGNAKDNSDDMRSKGRAIYPGAGPQNGEKNHNCKLSDDDVNYIRDVWRWGMGPELAKKFGVHPTTINKIRRGAAR
jgi:hypothetical protein